MSNNKKLEELSERISDLESKTCGTGGCETCMGFWLELVKAREERYELQVVAKAKGDTDNE